MENQNKDLQKINPQMLEQVGCKMPSIKLMKSLLTKNRIEINLIKQELTDQGSPKFEVLFSEGKSTQFSIVQRAIGDENMVKLLIVMIEDLVNYFNVQRPMNMDQMTDLAFEILPIFKFHRFEEIMIFFEGIKKSKWGKVYERLDSAVIWEMFEKYDNSRNDWITYDNTKDNYKEPIIKSDLENKLGGLNSVAGAIGNLRSNIGKLREAEKLRKNE